MSKNFMVGVQVHFIIILLKPLTGLQATKPMHHLISNTCTTFSYTSKTMKIVCKHIEMINAACCNQFFMKKVFGHLDLIEFLDKWRCASGKNGDSPCRSQADPPFTIIKILPRYSKHWLNLLQNV
jgi:hypothetical protein